MAEKLLTTKDVAQIAECEIQTVSRWAAKNDISYVGESSRKIYIFTKQDVQKFLNRPRPGKRKRG